MSNSERFLHRAGYYTRHRPSYPQDVVDLLAREGIVFPGAILADIGAGPGTSSELFLKAGCTVWAIEPNAEMREFAEQRFSGFNGYRSVNGTAEATTLPDASCHCAVAATAAHWFDHDRAPAEMRRILNPDGSLVLVWNRRVGGGAFEQRYNGVMAEFGSDYKERWEKERLRQEPLVQRYLAPGYREAVFPNRQVLDWEGLLGRVLSASYAPLPGTPNHDPMVTALKEVFDDFENNGAVEMAYDCVVYFGRPR